MNVSDIPVDALQTHIRTNAGARALITRRCNEGRISPRQASPELLRLLARAEELRAEAIRRGVMAKPKQALSRPEWLMES